MRGRLLVDEGIIKMAGIWDHLERFKNANRIIIIACGTSWHAGLIGEYLIEEYARIPVEVEYASEFRYRNPIITDKDVVIAISQSGETADTMAALKLAKEKGAFIYGICNVVDSSIARITDAGSYTHAGPEIGVASTKAFTAQLTILSLIALKLGKHNGNLGNAEFMSLIAELDAIPKKIEEVLSTTHELTQNIAKDFINTTNFLYLGRGYNYPAALEGALKLKEISYIHAEGYPAAEMKHGPIALIDENMPIVIIAPKKGHYDKIVSNVQEIKARKGKVIAVVNKGDKQVSEMADYVIEIPETSECFSPIVASVPLQLLAYYIAVYRGANVDQPRNLAKSVTVE
jgi:glucosamine--fructose-6-phosphate aminotransferase (isomerizing)